MNTTRPGQWQHRVTVTDHPAEAGVLLADTTGLSKSRVKRAMKNGAVWLRQGKKSRRIRHSSRTVKPGETLEIYYDEALLTASPPAAVCLHDENDYSIWFKPAGMLTQGTRFGDHFAIERAAELHFSGKRQTHLVHRLDRETPGVMVLAHSKKGAAALSALFREGRVEKIYRAELLGDIGSSDVPRVIDTPIEGQTAKTEWIQERFDPEAGISVVLVQLHTGRMHQIRRHFELAGYPVMGDPRYGTGNKNRDGLRLAAIYLSFRCPFLKKKVAFHTGGMSTDAILQWSGLETDILLMKR